MDEYAFVKYPTVRGVVIDGNPSGQTDSLLQVSAGHHTFALDGDADYEPPSQQVLVQGTTANDPMIVEFTASAG